MFFYTQVGNTGNQAHKNDLTLRTQVSNFDNFFSIVSRKIKFS
ncbi:hypothetical protein [Mycoplasmopsis felis]|nr:hypothetical protein [Mycoplasmopsis felis]UWV83494.1 hypothetical protein NWE58_04055 [Mycoplasmopsis felis]WAM02019.1 hypothetical protein ONA02_05365 [Mycoplasmopsis felis]